MNPHVPEEYGGLGLPGFDGMLVGEELSWGCAGIADLDHREHARFCAGHALGERRPEGEMAAAARRGADPVLVRPHGAERRLGRLRHRDDRGPPRRRVRHQRLEDVHHERRPRRLARRLRLDGQEQGPQGPVRVRRPDRPRRRRRREAPGQDGSARDRHVRDRVRRRQGARREPARRGGRGLQDRHEDARLHAARAQPPAPSGSHRQRSTTRSSTRRRGCSSASRSR